MTQAPAPVVHYVRVKPTTARGTFRPACACGWTVVVNTTRGRAEKRTEQHVKEAEAAK